MIPTPHGHDRFLSQHFHEGLLEGLRTGNPGENGGFPFG